MVDMMVFNRLILMVIMMTRDIAVVGGEASTGVD